MIRHSMLLAVAGAVMAPVILASQALADGVPPAPAAGPSAKPSAPTAGGFAPPPSCLRDFTPLRDETLLRGRLVRAASERHVPAAEACRLVHDYELAQTKMIDFAVSHAESCGIPAKITDQLRAGHDSSVTLLKKVCTSTQQVPMHATARSDGRPDRDGAVEGRAAFGRVRTETGLSAS